MTFVVEIASPAGHRAIREYDAPSRSAAVHAAESELRTFPQFEIMRVWHKDEPAPSEGFGEAEEW